MKVIHILKGKANPDTMNGVNKVVHNLATEQLRLGIDVEVWGITATPEVIRHKHDYPLKLFPETKRRFVLSSALNNALDSIRPKDVMVHLHSVFLPELFAVSRRLKKNKISWVLSPHSGYNPNSMMKNKLLKIIYMRFFERQLITGATKIHAIGASEIAEIQSLDADANIVLIPNGQSFDDVLFTPTVCDEPSGRPVFGFCGRLAIAHKGLDLLIKGFSRYKKNGGSGELWLIGDGPDYKLLNEIIDKQGVGNTVKLFGTLFGDSKISCLDKMDLFVHTSRWEGMPMAVLEASALGKPVLISEATNMSSYVKQYGNGIVLEENTPRYIEEALIRFSKLYTDKENIIMGKASIKLIEDEFSWKTIVKSMAKQLYM